MHNYNNKKYFGGKYDQFVDILPFKINYERHFPGIKNNQKIMSIIQPTYDTLTIIHSDI